MTHHKNNRKACELLSEIQKQAGQLWGNCQMYTSGEAGSGLITTLEVMKEKLERWNRIMEE